MNTCKAAGHGRKINFPKLLLMVVVMAVMVVVLVDRERA